MYLCYVLWVGPIDLVPSEPQVMNMPPEIGTNLLIFSFHCPNSGQQPTEPSCPFSYGKTFKKLASPLPASTLLTQEATAVPLRKS